MSVYGRSNIAWTFIKQQLMLEPPSKMSLTNCTLNELQEKIDYFKTRYFLLMSACEALEMYVVKQQPELVNSGDIDVSWMPYELNCTGFKLDQRLAQTDVEENKQCGRLLEKENTGTTNMCSVVLKMIETNQNVSSITINHLAFMVKNVVKFAKDDFKKRYDKLLMENIILENKIENVEEDRIRILKNAENYRKEILVAGVDQMTKRVPAEKYERFSKRRGTTTGSTLNSLHLKTMATTKEVQWLLDERDKLENKRDKVTINDCMLAKLRNEALTESAMKAQNLTDEIKGYKNSVLKDYTKKKNEMEKYERSVNFTSLNAQINSFKNQEIETTSIAKLTAEIVDNDGSDNTLMTHVPKAIKSCTEEFNKIEHCMKLKNYIDQSNREIKFMEKQLDHQNQVINFLLNRSKKNKAGVKH